MPLDDDGDVDDAASAATRVPLARSVHPSCVGSDFDGVTGGHHRRGSDATGYWDYMRAYRHSRPDLGHRCRE